MLEPHPELQAIGRYITSRPHDDIINGHFRVSDPIGGQLPLLKIRFVHIQM